MSVQNFTCHLGVGLPSHIATVAPDGSDARRVTDDGDPQLGSFDRFPSFSPDGSRIAFAHGSVDSGSIQITAARGGGDRTAVLADGDAVAAIPVWSPDGSRIAYAVGRAIKAVAASGGAPEVIAKGLPMVSCGSGGLAWSPDGKRIAVGRGAGIYLITVGDPGSARLAIRAPCAGNPSFSPDGEQIAFDARPAHPLRRADRDHGRAGRRHRRPDAQHGAVPAERAPLLAAAPVKEREGAWRPVQAKPAATRALHP